MQVSRRVLGFCAAVLGAATLAASGSATAAFPDFSGCPTGSDVIACVDVQSRSGSMDIKGFTVPLGDSLRIRGGIVGTSDPELGAMRAPTNGGVFVARPVNVPGGLLGIDFPIPGNAVTATAKLAGPASSLRINPTQLRLKLPMKLKLDNPILGLFCTIGTDSSPANVDLIIGTTNPPAPNRPISGRAGRLSFDPATGTLILADNLNVDNAFSIPGASSCGLGLGLVNTVINAKLKLPSAGGNNTLMVGSDAALRVPR
jgi:hypothetical protein